MKKVPPQKSNRVVKDYEVHIFNHNDNKYLYAIRTGTLLKVDNLCEKVIEMRKEYSRETVLAMLSHQYKRKDVLDTITEIEELNKAKVLFTKDKVRQHGGRDFSAGKVNKLYRNKNLVNVTLEMSEHCNMQCIYCFGTDTYMKTRRNMPWSTVKKSIEYLFQNSQAPNITFTFFGGEPLLNWNNIEKAAEYALKLAKNNGKKVAFDITTNGSLLNKRKVEFLRDKQIHVLLSIDGAPDIQALQRPLKNKKASFQKAIPYIKMLNEMSRNSNLGVSARVTLTKYNASRLYEDFLYLVEDLGFRSVKIIPMYFVQKKELSLDQHDVDIIMRGIEKIVEYDFENLPKMKKLVFFSIWDICLKILHRQDFSYVSCGAGLGMRAITVEGNIFPCYLFADKPEFKIGTVWDEKPPFVSDALKKLVKYQKINYTKKCIGCRALLSCKGACIASRHREGRWHPPYLLCDLQRGVFDLAVHNYLDLWEKGLHEKYFGKRSKPKGETTS